MARKLYDNPKGKYKAIIMLELLLDGEILVTKAGSYLAMDPENHKIGLLRLNNDNLKEPHTDNNGNYEIIYFWDQELNYFIDWVDQIPDDNFFAMVAQVGLQRINRNGL